MQLFVLMKVIYYINILKNSKCMNIDCSKNWKLSKKIYKRSRFIYR